MGGEANSGHADVPAQVGAERRNQVAVVSLGSVCHGKIRFAPVNGSRMVGVEKSLERPILHVLGNVVLAQIGIDADAIRPGQSK